MGVKDKTSNSKGTRYLMCPACQNEDGLQQMNFPLVSARTYDTKHCHGYHCFYVCRCGNMFVDRTDWFLGSR